MQESQVLQEFTNLRTQPFWKNWRTRDLQLIAALATASAEPVGFSPQSLGKRMAAGSLSTTSAAIRVVTGTLTRPATTNSYTNNQVIGSSAVSPSSVITLPNLFGSNAPTTVINVRRVLILRTIATGSFPSIPSLRLTTLSGTVTAQPDLATLSISQAQSTAVVSTVTNVSWSSIGAQFSLGEVNVPFLAQIQPGNTTGNGFCILSATGGGFSGQPSERYDVIYYIED